MELNRLHDSPEETDQDVRRKTVDAQLGEFVIAINPESLVLVPDAIMLIVLKIANEAQEIRDIAIQRALRCSLEIPVADLLRSSPY